MVSLLLLALCLPLSAQQWASHHNMTGADYQNKFNDYKKKGYRLVFVDGYGVRGKPYYAGIWEKKGGPAYATHHGMTGKEYQNKFNAYKQQGYRLVLVDGGGTRSAFYTAIWEKKGGPAYATHHGMSATDYQNKFNDYKQKGYRLSWVSGYGVGNEAYYAAIWEKTGGPAYATQHCTRSSD